MDIYKLLSDSDSRHDTTEELTASTDKMAGNKVLWKVLEYMFRVLEGLDRFMVDSARCGIFLIFYMMYR